MVLFDMKIVKILLNNFWIFHTNGAWVDIKKVLADKNIQNSLVATIHGSFRWNESAIAQKRGNRDGNRAKSVTVVEPVPEIEEDRDLGDEKEKGMIREATQRTDQGIVVGIENVERKNVSPIFDFFNKCSNFRTLRKFYYRDCK